MKMRITTLISCIGLLVAIHFLGCRTPQVAQDAPSEAVTYTIISQGGHCNITQEEQIWLTDQEEWENLWKRLMANRFPTPELPEVNFGEDGILACFMGERPSGGYSIKLISLSQKKGSLNADWQYVQPGANCITTDMLSAPYILVRVPREGIDKASHTMSTETFNCN